MEISYWLWDLILTLAEYAVGASAGVMFALVHVDLPEEGGEACMAEELLVFSATTTITQAPRSGTWREQGALPPSSTTRTTTRGVIHRRQSDTLPNTL